DLDSYEARVLPGTELAQAPFWSPDSRFLGFFANGKLKKIDLTGGAPLILCDSVFSIAGAWGKNDSILFTPGLGGLYRVPAAGGIPTAVTEVETGKELLHTAPSFLPDGHHFLYSAVTPGLNEATTFVGDLDSKTRRQVVLANTNAMYAPPGY